jgi:xylulokinase
MSLLGIDIGTTGCKAIVFRVDGQVLGHAYREYPLIHPREGWTELDPSQVWACVSCRCTRCTR